MNWRHVVAGAIVLFLLGLVIGMIDIPTNSTKKEIPTASSVIANRKGVLPPYVVSKKVLSAIGTEVLPNVFDDGQSSVYIRADYQWMNPVEIQLVDILYKKRYWESKFSTTKRIISTSNVTGNGGTYGSSFLAGMLIHYEQRQ